MEQKQQNFNTEKPLTLKEVSDYLSVSPSTLYKLVAKNKIPVHRPTGKLYFDKYA